VVISKALLSNQKKLTCTRFCLGSLGKKPIRSVIIKNKTKRETRISYGSLQPETWPRSLGSFDKEIDRWTQGCPFQKLMLKYSVAALMLLAIAVVAIVLALSRNEGKSVNLWVNLRDQPNALRKHSNLLQSGQGFDETVAMQILVYAGAAYEDDEEVLASCVPSFEVHTKLTAQDPYGIAIKGFTGIYNGEFIVVAVEGTNTNEQLISEWSNLGPESYMNHEEAQVVSYFSSIADQMLNDTVLSLNSLLSNCSSCPVYFTGHSLGGSSLTILLTTIFELGLLSFPTQPHIYTFGQPRTGNKAFSELSSSYFDVYRVVNSKDPVAHIPCCNFKLYGSNAYECMDVEGYWSPWHNYQEIYYEDMSQSQYTECEGEGEDMDCADSVRWNSYALDDHYYYYNVRVGYMCSYLTGGISNADFYYDEEYKSDALKLESFNVSDPDSLNRFTCIVF